MFEKFTERARKVLSLSRQQAQRFNAEFIGTEAMLLGLLQEDGGIAAKVLKMHEIDAIKVEATLDTIMLKGERQTVTLGQLPFSPRAKRVIEIASAISQKMAHDVIGTEHLLVGVLEETEGLGHQVIVKMGITPGKLIEEIYEILGYDPKAAKEQEKTPEPRKAAFEVHRVVFRPVQQTSQVVRITVDVEASSAETAIMEARQLTILHSPEHWAVESSNRAGYGIRKA
jgi:ATP-dependent Clp protease ATP-binding subunit ClpA